MNTLSNVLFDAVIPYHEKDSEILPYCIESLRKNTTGLRNIYIISEAEPDLDEDFEWIPESAFCFSIDTVGEYIKSTNGRQGWYYQQLLKFYIHKIIPELLTHYLILDSDVVFIHPIELFNGEKILLDYGGQYVQDYINHMASILPDVFINTTKDVGVTDSMMFRKDIIEDLSNRIEVKHKMPMWQALLSHVLPEFYNYSGMSEYEMYFQFALLQYPESHERRFLKKGRGVFLNELQRTDVDVIAFHRWFRDWQRGLTNNS